jgi:hypothetical protein
MNQQSCYYCDCNRRRTHNLKLLLEMGFLSLERCYGRLQLLRLRRRLPKIAQGFT